MNAKDYRTDLRHKIIATATKLFLQKSIKNVKMDDIASSLSISKRTLYELFADKEALLYEVITAHDDAIKEELDRTNATAADVMERLYNFFTLAMRELNGLTPTFYEEVHKYRSVLKKIDEREKSKRDRFMSFITRGVAEGYFIDGLDYDLVFEAGDVAAKAFGDHNLQKKYGLKKTFVTTCTMFLRGICTEKGMKRLTEIVLEDRTKAENAKTETAK